MEPDPVRVLLVGERPQGHSFLRQRLEDHGCECSSAPSGDEAVLMGAASGFDFVLCVDKVQGIATLISSMLRSSGTLYCSHLLDDGSIWWLAVKKGLDCLGSPALWPSEFVVALDKLIAEAKSRHLGAATTVAAA